MTLDRLAITDFKNIASATLEFSPKINCLLGNNGMGKSNLLDALYLLSYCRSFSGLADSQLIRRGCEFSILAGEYRRRGMPEHLQAVLRPGRRKSLKRAGKEYRRLADHLGAFPLVLVSPADFILAAGEPAERRRLLDQIASQSDPAYLDALMRYSQAMDQRNRLLRAENTDSALYDALELQMDAAGTRLCAGRAKTVAALEPLMKAFHASIAPGAATALTYCGALSADNCTPGLIADRLEANRRRDLAVGYTTWGPHRDDVEFLLDDIPVRRVASQGQTKTFTVALRFAQYALLRQNLALAPLLLLDDIFDKLDSARVEGIIAAVASTEAFGQIFITDTNRRHLDETVALLGNTGANSRLWTVDNGNFQAMDAL